MVKVLDLIPIGTRIIGQTAFGKGKVGDLYLPKTATADEIQEAVVVAVGPDVTLIKIGQSIYYGRYAGITITRNEEKFVLMDEVDVLAIIDNNKGECDGRTN